MWTLHPYRIPLRTPYAWAQGVQHEREGMLVSFREANATGWGEAAPPPGEAVPEAWQTPGSCEAALQSRQGRLFAASLGAQWAANAEHARQPLGDWVANAHDLPEPSRTVACNALIPATDSTSAEAAARAATTAGYQVLKVKANGNIAADLRRIQAVHRAAPDALLRIDPNQSWRETGPALLQLVAAVGNSCIDYVEQPCPGPLIEELRSSPVPLAVDEAATGAPVLDVYKGQGLRPVVVCKLQRLAWTGFVEMLKAAQVRSMRTVVTNSLETAVGRAHAWHAASLTREVSGLATGHFLARDVAHLPDAPLKTLNGAGLGLEIHDSNFA